MDHTGVGWCEVGHTEVGVGHAGVGWVMQGCSGSFRGWVGWVMQ